MSGEDDDRGDRPRLSWSEQDKRRGKARGHTGERRPRGAAAEALAAKAAQSYLKKLDQQLFRPFQYPVVVFSHIKEYTVLLWDLHHRFGSFQIDLQGGQWSCRFRCIHDYRLVRISEYCNS